MPASIEANQVLSHLLHLHQNKTFYLALIQASILICSYMAFISFRKISHCTSVLKISNVSDALHNDLKTPDMWLKPNGSLECYSQHIYALRKILFLLTILSTQLKPSG